MRPMIGCLLVVISATANAELVTNGDFEIAGDNHLDIQGWTVTGFPRIGVIPNRGNNDTVVTSMASRSSLEQEITGFEVGATYALSFDYNTTSHGAIADLYFGRGQIESFPDDRILGVFGRDPWHFFSHEFVADQTTMPFLLSVTRGELLLDNVSVDFVDILLGDFDRNGRVSLEDIDALTIAALSDEHPAEFDLNDDGFVNQQDRTIWIEEIANTWLGDSGLDGEFDSADFVSVFNRAEYRDNIEKNSSWIDGDWNGDLEFDSRDFVAAFKAGGYNAGPRAAVANVPEPSSLGCLVVGLVGIIWRAHKSTAAIA